MAVFLRAKTGLFCVTVFFEISRYLLCSEKMCDERLLLLYNFLSATYNLISGTNPHEEDYRLTVDWHSCGFFYS